MKVIIIGAGASGLMAARELVKKDIEVLVLEKADRIGGRIHTFVPPGFTNSIEAGAEFIHGNLKLTQSLVKRARQAIAPVSGKMYRFENGKMRSTFGQSKPWEEFYTALQNLKTDCTLEEFLQKSFGTARYKKLRLEIREMAQGLDLADPAQLSVLGIREEWLSEETQYRPVGGYGPLLEFIRNDAASEKYQLLLNQEVSQIGWKPGRVEVHTQNAHFKANAVLITIALGSLFKKEIRFDPPIAETEKLFSAIGFGGVIKMALEFDDAFWNQEYPDLGFLFTQDGITFWSQLSQQRPLLTAWIGAGYIGQYRNCSDRELTGKAMDQLSAVFGKVKQKASAVFRYDDQSTPGGGYSWLRPGSKKAIRKINQGIENTIWFAGEALHPGTETATVEAALQSGKFAARRILKSL